MSDDHVSDSAGPSLPDASTLHHAYAALVEGLTVAAKDYREAPTPEDQRSASRGAIVSVLMFLDRTGAPSDLRSPLFDLSLALDELDKGAVEPMLVKKKFRGAPKLSLKHREARAKIAFACHLLFKSGLSLDEASRYCARKIGGVIAHEQVEDWRDQAMSGLASEDIASRLYQRYAEQVDNGPHMNLGEARKIADQLLDVARVELTRTNPK
jgi:hypothetical protein